jgi:hypothetical protein
MLLALKGVDHAIDHSSIDDELRNMVNDLAALGFA